MGVRWKPVSAEELLVVDQKAADLRAVEVPWLVEADRRKIEAVAVPGMGSARHSSAEALHLEPAIAATLVPERICWMELPRRWMEEADMATRRAVRERVLAVEGASSPALAAWAVMATVERMH